jgi:hypothetical protein
LAVGVTYQQTGINSNDKSNDKNCRSGEDETAQQ